MAAGDTRLKITSICFEPGAQVHVDFQFGTEHKNGQIDFRNSSFSMSWQDFWSRLTLGERNALGNIRDKMLAYMRQELDITNWGQALDA